MSWHIHSNGSDVWDSDGYGSETEYQEPSEMIEEKLTAKDNTEIAIDVADFMKDLASRFFNTDEWEDAEWTAWYDKIRTENM